MGNLNQKDHKFKRRIKLINKTFKLNLFKINKKNKISNKMLKFKKFPLKKLNKI